MQGGILSDEKSVGRGPTNKTSNENGGSNEGHNNNRNSCRLDRSGNLYRTSKFKGKVEGLSTLGAKNTKITDLFIVFQKELHTYVIANCKHPS